MKRNNKGFTLIEIITVIVILGIIGTIATIGVSKYIKNAKDNTYKSYEKSMRTSASNKMVECVSKNSNCEIPESSNTKKISLEELIDEEYSEKLKDPEKEGEYCSGYVEVQNDGASVPDLKYKACLKCSKYKSEGCNFKEDNDDDNKILSCDKLNTKGESTKWTSNNRVIKFGCDSEGNNCKYQKTFTATTKEGTIKIASGEICKVNVYVDKTRPTCKIIVEEGKLGENGWYLEEVDAKLSYKSATRVGREVDGSKFTYGISSSSKKEYNNKDSLKVKTGITTVFGYVKDDLGNESYCSSEIKVDSTKPTQNLVLGYQVYKEDKNDITEEQDELIIGNLEKYTGVRGIIIKLTEKKTGNILIQYSNIQPTTLKMTNSIGGSITKELEIYANNEKELEVILPSASTFDTLDIIGIDPDKIDKIYLLVGNTNGLYTNKDMIVYNFASDNTTGVASSNGYSFDGGKTWQSSKYKSYSVNQMVETVVRDSIGTMSSVKKINVNKIDKEAPNCNISGNPTNWTNQNVELRVSATDTGVSGVDTIKKDHEEEEEYDGTYISTIKSNGTYNYEVKDKAGNSGSCSAIVSKIDKQAPTVTITIPDFKVSKTKTATIKIKDDLSKLQGQTVYYGWGKSESTAQYSSIVITDNTQEKVITSTSPANLNGTYYLFVKGGIKDKAGNETVKKQSKAITLDNTAPSCPTITEKSGTTSKKWTNNTISLYINPTTDTESWKWQISTDGGNYIGLDEIFVGPRQFEAFSENGKKKGKVIVKDSAGNTRECDTDEYWIDKTKPEAPTVIMTHSYDSQREQGDKAKVYNNDTWINKAVYMTDARSTPYIGPSSTDKGGSGLKELQISSDNKNWEVYSYDYTRQLYRLTTEGTNYRYFRAVDNAGNYSDVVKKTIKIDTTAPSCPVITKVAGGNVKTWSNTTVNLTITPTSDTVSWDWATNTNGGAYTTFETNVVGVGKNFEFTGNGKRTGRITVRDSLGNTKVCYTDEYWIDTKAPTVPTVKFYKWKDNSSRPNSINGLTSYTPGSTSDKKIYTVASGSTDDGVGGVYYQYTTTGSTTNNTNKTGGYRHIEAWGTSYIKYRACDKLGNCSAYTTNYTVILDKGPTVTIGGNNGKWQVVYRKRSSCDAWAAKVNGSCPSNVYGNIIAKVDMSYKGSEVTFNYNIAQGSETYIALSYWVKLHIIKDGTTVKTFNLKDTSGKWSGGSVHSGNVSATLSKGTYTIKMEGNSETPNYTANLGTVTIK